jgi:hypothetical protein
LNDIPQNWLDRNWKWFVPLLLAMSLLLVLLFIGAIAYIGLQLVKSSDVYQIALNQIQASEQALQILGEPIEAGWYVIGKINITNDRGEAQLQIPVSGPRNEGTIFLDATKKEGKWLFETLVLNINATGFKFSLLENTVGSNEHFDDYGMSE